MATIPSRVTIPANSPNYANNKFDPMAKPIELVVHLLNPEIFSVLSAGGRLSSDLSSQMFAVVKDYTGIY